MNVYKRMLMVLGFSLQAGLVAAQTTFPDRPITIVVPYPAGGTSDIQVRMIQEPLSEILGQPVIVENKPGGSGAVSAQAVARAKPDGYTLLYPNNGFIIAPLLSKDLNYYDPLRDFKPVSLVTSVPMTLFAKKNIPAASLKDFVAYAKNAPQGLLAATAGPASFGYLATMYFADMAGIQVESVNYRGEAAMTLAVRAGEVDMVLTTPSAAMLGQVREGHAITLGVGTKAPSPVVPGVPTMDSAIPGFSAEAWFGLVAPAQTPDDVIAKIHTALRQVMARQDIQQRLLPTGAIARTNSPTEYRELLINETRQWKDLLARTGITTAN